MKKAIGMICLLLFLVGIIVWEQISVSVYLTDIKIITDNLSEMVAGSEQINTTQVYEEVEHLEEVWKKHESILCLVANHKDMQDLSIEIERMKACVSVNQFEDFKASLTIIMYFTEAYNHFMGISFQNIF